MNDQNKSRASWYLTFMVVGALAGGSLGFLVRPSAPVIGQLPLSVVMSRGSNLQGLDAFLRPVAQKSFGYLALGTLVGLLGGLVLAELIGQGRDTGSNASIAGPTALGGPPKRIEKGQTLDQVTRVLGPPVSEFAMGDKILHVYPSVKVTFIEGRVADVE